MREDRLQDVEMLELLKLVAPGTPLREGLDNILRARTGAVIVIGDSQEVLKNVDGGFYINKDYMPAHIYELAKMDGAIIISKDLKKILSANVLLVPDSSIQTKETGTRHKTAERFAKQTNEIVICISQRRNIITLYKGSNKYILRDTSTILTRANQALQTLEKYKMAVDVAMANLNVLEIYDIVTLSDVAVVIQRTEMVMRIVAEIEWYICELGNEGRLISMQLEELLINIEEEGIMVIEDYMHSEENKTAEEILRKISLFSDDELMDLASICIAMGYSGGVSTFELSISPSGYRIMSKIPRVPMNIINNLVSTFTNLQGILNASMEELDNVDGIGDVRARMIKDGLKRVQEQILFNKRQI